MVTFRGFGLWLENLSVLPTLPPTFPFQIISTPPTTNLERATQIHQELQNRGTQMPASFTRGQFQTIAEIIRWIEGRNIRERVVPVFANYFERNCPHFDRERFYEACGLQYRTVRYEIHTPEEHNSLSESEEIEQSESHEN
jgi:hypothetical protein